MSHGGRLPILTFHAIDDGASAIAFPPERFEACLDLLDRGGYRTLSLAEVAAGLRAGVDLPARAVVVTFDDGYRSVFAEAYPRLRAHGMSATLFLIAGRDAQADGALRFPTRCGREMLCWDEVALLAAAGWEIGAHTVSHVDLSRISAEQAIDEMAESKRRIEQRLGGRVATFAYPYGRQNPAARFWLERELDCACGVSLGLASRLSDRFSLERVDMYYLRAPRLLPLLVSPWLSPYLRARRGPRQLRGWLRDRLGD